MKLFSFLLCLCLFLSLPLFVSCQMEEEIPPTVSPSAGDAGFGVQKHVAEEDIPLRKDLTEWYEEAKKREQISCAIFYAKSNADGRWHCWLYIAAHQEGDTLEYGYNEETDTVLFRHTAADTEKSGQKGVFYFTLDRDTEPNFECYQNDNYAGLIMTHADEAIHP